MSKKTTSKTKPWNEGAINNAQTMLASTVSENQPQLNANASLINSNLPGLASRAFGTDPTIAAAQNYSQDVLGGKYLNGNEHLQGMIDKTGASVADRYNSIFSRAGRTGSTQHGQDLSRGLADAENTMRYSDYEAERNRMGQISGQVPGLTAASYAGIEPFLAAVQSGSETPLLGARALAQGTAQLQSPWSTTTQKKSLGQSLMDAATAAAMAYAQSGGSDRRLKTDIVKVGEESDGLGIYDFAYAVDPSQRFRGVMADEVAELRPWALGPDLPGGFASVNYGAL